MRGQSEHEDWTASLQLETELARGRNLKGCDILPDDQHIGRAAGVACAASGTADVVDAIVVATAVRHQAPIVTSDPGDLTHIADAIGVKIPLYPT